MRPPWRPAPPPPADTPVADLPPFVRGHEVCFDAWRDRGNPGWGYADVLPAFKRLERYEAGASQTRGGDGPLSVMHCWDPHTAHRAFLMACVPSGYRQDSRHDFNGPRSQSVAGYYQKAILDDRPHTLDAAFLAPVRARPTVSLVTGGHVSRVVLERTRAVGVEYVVGHAREVIRAERAVIVGADPVRAAQLLMLSGIGPADALRALDVAVVADRAGVGRNLHDQLCLELRWRALQPLPSLVGHGRDVHRVAECVAARPADRLCRPAPRRRGRARPRCDAGAAVVARRPAARVAECQRRAGGVDQSHRHRG